MSKKQKLRLGAVIICCVCLLAGCGSDMVEKQEQYKQEGIAAMSAGDYELAVQQFQEALSLSRGKITAEEIDLCYYKAAALYQAGKTTEAVQVYTSLIEYDKKNADPYFLRGSVYAGERDLEKALKDYKEAVGRSPEDYELHIAVYENLKARGTACSAGKFICFLNSMTRRKRY